MAPFLRAIQVKASSSNAEYTSYAGEIDSDWLVGAVSNGGYILALLVDACIQHQSTSSHRDPIHVTAHFLRTSVPSPFEIRVRILKTGRNLTNLTAELYQRGALIVTAHQIFGNNSNLPQARDHTRGLTLAPPSSYARRIPLYTHPSTAVVRPVRSVWKFKSYIAMAPDPHILAKNAPNHPNRTDAFSVGGEGLEWGAWLTFQDKTDQVTSTSLAFLVDVFTNMPGLLPSSERPGLGLSWFPTIVLSLEFKAPIPPPSSAHAKRTVGLYSSGKFLNDGRHDGYAEVWTAPCDIGEGEELTGWREKQVCIAVATQMASVIPIEVNMNLGRNESYQLLSATTIKDRLCRTPVSGYVQKLEACWNLVIQMAPFRQAVQVESASKEEGEYRTYTGTVDPEWVVGAVPNGGYILALLVEACIQHQSKKSHPDPIHVTAHYLRSSQTSAFEIRVKTLKTGRGFTNLTAELYQQGTVTVTTQQIFGVNSVLPDQTSGLTLAPPSTYARRIPLYSHPSTAVVQPARDVCKYKSYFALSRDPVIFEKNAPDHPNRTNASTVGGAGLEWGGWFSFTDKGDEITKNSLAFLVDVFAGLPMLMPPSERPGLGISWYPTMVFAVEFKAPIPRFSADHANRTVGVYYSSKFVNDGRHDNNIEIWTAPCNIGEGKEVPGWREKQVCIATATQLSLIVPMEVNLARAKKRENKL